MFQINGLRTCKGQLWVLHFFMYTVLPDWLPVSVLFHLSHAATALLLNVLMPVGMGLTAEARLQPPCLEDHAGSGVPP